MKKFILILLLFVSFSAIGQTNRFPSIDSLKTYILKYVRNSTVESFTNLRLQNVVYGTAELLDSLTANMSGGVDSIWKSAGGGSDTLKYSKGGTTYTIGVLSNGAYVPYTGATADVDLGNFGLNAKGISVTGTAGNGHLHLKHQSSAPSSTGSSTTVYADANGNLAYKNDGLNRVTFNGLNITADRTFSFQNKSYTLADSADVAGKQGALTLTTTGSSGAATLVGNTLNIPQYSGGGGGVDSLKNLSDVSIPTPTTGQGLEYNSSTGKWEKTPTRVPQTLTDGATVTWDASSGLNAALTLGGNRTLAITNAKAGQFGTLLVTQGGGGGFNISLPDSSAVIGDGAGVIVLSATAGKKDIITWYYDGSNYYWTYGKDYTKATVYDTDAQAYFTAAGITDVDQKNAWNTFVLAAKSHGYWTKFYAVYPFIGGTSTTHKFNAKNPVDTDGAYRLTFTGSPTHDANGFTGGTGKYADTKLVPSTALTSTNFSLGYIASGSLALDGNYSMGSYSGSPNKVVGLKPSGTFTNAYAGDFENDIISGSPLGFIAVTRNSLSSMEVSRNGSYTNQPNTFVGFPAFSMYIGGLNESGSITSYTSVTFKFAFIAEHLSSAEMLDLYTDAAALQTALGR